MDSNDISARLRALYGSFKLVCNTKAYVDLLPIPKRFASATGPAQ